MNVMKKAWEIAKQGQAKFGGKVKEYLASALKMAWALAKKASKIVEIELFEGSRKHKSWVAEIVGLDASYGYDRDFLDYDDKGMRAKFFELEEGKIYDVCNAGDREFVQVVNGEVEEISVATIRKRLMDVSAQDYMERAIAGKLQFDRNYVKVTDGIEFKCLESKGSTITFGPGEKLQELRAKHEAEETLESMLKLQEAADDVRNYDITKAVAVKFQGKEYKVVSGKVI